MWWVMRSSGAGEAFRTERFDPFVKWQVAGNQGGTALVVLRDQLVQQFPPVLESGTKPSSSIMRSWWASICFWSRSKRGSSRATIISLTSAAAVVKPRDILGATLFKRIEHEHQADGDQSEDLKGVHSFIPHRSHPSARNWRCGN